jgi:hypothetical protein
MRSSRPTALGTIPYLAEQKHEGRRRGRIPAGRG